MEKKKAAPRQRPYDVNLLAHMLGAESTKDIAGPSKDEVSRVMAAMGRKGGKVGGKARGDSLTKERRLDIAKAAAKKRWGAKKDPEYKKRIAALVATQII